MNAIQQLYSVSYEEKPLHSQSHEDLLCPVTGQIEPMRLQLYAKHSNSYALWRRVRKAPVGRFFRAEDGREIEERYWTADMKRVHDIAIKGNPVKEASTSLTLWGKFVLLLLLAALGYATYVVYDYTASKTNKEVTIDSIATTDSLSVEHGTIL